MNTKIDLKSAALGLGAGLLIMLGVAASSSPGSAGRYQVAGTSNHAIILDTATGQAWSAFFASGGGRSDGEFYRTKAEVQK